MHPSFAINLTHAVGATYVLIDFTDGGCDAAFLGNTWTSKEPAQSKAVFLVVEITNKG
jgi:hypothetical protein